MSTSDNKTDDILPFAPEERWRKTADSLPDRHREVFVLLRTAEGPLRISAGWRDRAGWVLLGDAGLLHVIAWRPIFENDLPAWARPDSYVPRRRMPSPGLGEDSTNREEEE